MNQDEETQTPEKRRLLEEAVEQHGQTLERVQEVLQRPGPNEEEVRQAIEESVRQADEVKRELERQETGMLPKGAPNPVP
jgi:U3 small nucleolar RNA-associated protein 14